jgi:hypothetical protein
MGGMMTLYFIQAGTDGPVKIGFTNGDPAGRLKELQVGSPIALRLLRTIDNAGMKVEAWFHARYADCRLVGEWFEFNPEMLAVEPPHEIRGRDASYKTRREAEATERQFSHEFAQFRAQFDTPDEREFDRHMQHRAIATAVACGERAKRYIDDARARVNDGDLDAGELALNHSDQFKQLARDWLAKAAAIRDRR